MALSNSLKNKELNGFEKREMLGKDYWNDSRWKEVRKLRTTGQNSKANGLVCAIRNDWGIL